MNKKQLRQLEAASGCEDTIKKRIIAAILIVAGGFISGLFKNVGVLGILEVVITFAFVLVPICAVPYRVVATAAGRKIYLEDGDIITIPSRLFGWIAAIAALFAFAYAMNFLGKRLPSSEIVNGISIAAFFVIGFFWLCSDIKTVLAARKIETEYFSTQGADSSHAQGLEETNFFAGCNNAASVKERYRSLMKIYHPDLQHGDTSFAKVINEQYEEESGKYKVST